MTHDDHLWLDVGDGYCLLKIGRNSDLSNLVVDLFTIASHFQFLTPFTSIWDLLFGVVGMRCSPSSPADTAADCHRPD